MKFSSQEYEFQKYKHDFVKEHFNSSNRFDFWVFYHLETELKGHMNVIIRDSKL